MHATKLNYYEADKDLRAALPNVKDNPAILATTLFHLGVANYQLGMQLGTDPAFWKPRSSVTRRPGFPVLFRSRPGEMLRS